MFLLLKQAKISLAMLNLMHLYQVSVVNGKQHQGHLWSHLMWGSPNGLELEHQWEGSPGWHKGHKPLVGGSCCASSPVPGGTVLKKSWKIVPPSHVSLAEQRSNAKSSTGNATLLSPPAPWLAQAGSSCVVTGERGVRPGVPSRRGLVWTSQSDCWCPLD